MRRSEPIPPVPMSCAAIMRSASPGPPRMRTSPTATVNRITPAVARGKSVKAKSPDEQPLFRPEISRDWLPYIRSAPSSFVPVGGVPGIRLESAQNALRSPPSGNRNGQATKPGLSFSLGLSARQATSVPETTDCRKKLAASVQSEASLSRDRFGGRKRKLVQVAPATAASPTGRSAGDHPEIMSQKDEKERRSCGRGPREAKRPVISRYAQWVIPACETEAMRGRTGDIARKPWSGIWPRSSVERLAIRDPIPVLRESAEPPCSVQRGKHRRVFERALRFRGLAMSTAGWRPRRQAQRIGAADSVRSSERARAVVRHGGGSAWRCRDIG